MGSVDPALVICACYIVVQEVLLGPRGHFLLVATGRFVAGHLYQYSGRSDHYLGTYEVVRQCCRGRSLECGPFFVKLTAWPRTLVLWRENGFGMVAEFAVTVKH